MLYVLQTCFHGFARVLELVACLVEVSATSPVIRIDEILKVDDKTTEVWHSELIVRMD